MDVGHGRVQRAMLTALVGLGLVGCDASPIPTQSVEPSIPQSPTPTPDSGVDRLFAATEQCELELAGYRVMVSFPLTWLTIDAVPDGAPTCVSFTPENPDPGPLRAPQSIMLGGVGGPAVFRYDWVSRDEVTIATRPAWRVEERVPSLISDDQRTLQLVYWVPLDPTSTGGPTLVARTSVAESGDDYELNKAVLDRMMALLVIQ